MVCTPIQLSEFAASTLRKSTRSCRANCAPRLRADSVCQNSTAAKATQAASSHSPGGCTPTSLNAIAITSYSRNAHSGRIRCSRFAKLVRSSPAPAASADPGSTRGSSTSSAGSTENTSTSPAAK